MNRVAVPAALLCLLLAGTAAAQQRPQCGSLFPLSMPPHPGSCFVETPLGSFFFLYDLYGNFLLVETFGDTDDQVQLRPNGRISAHQTEREARFVYCPPGVTGRNCLISVFTPGPGGFPGGGRLHVNTDASVTFNYTCPSTVTARGKVTDPQTGEERDLTLRLIRVRNPDGSCRDLQSDIRLLP